MHPTPDSPTAEIAIWRQERTAPGMSDLQQWANGDSVQGWVSWDDVQRVLDLCERDEILTRSEQPVADAGLVQS